MSEPLVQEAIRRYHDLLGTHLTSTRDGLDKYATRVDCYFLRPCFVAADAYKALLETTALLNKGVITAAEHLTRDPSLRRKIAIPEYVDSLIALDAEDGVPAVMARFDGIIDRNGLFKAFEYNSVPGFDHAEWARVAFSEMPIAEAFGQLYSVRTTQLFDLCTNALILDHQKSGREGKPVVGVPITLVNGKAPELPTWLARVEERGCPVVVAPYADFKFEGGRLLSSTGVAIDAILPKWDELLPIIGSGLPIIDAIRARAVRTVNGLSRGLLAAYKNTFELLSNPEYAALFEPSVGAALAKHIPWTRVLRNGATTYRGLRVDLLPFLLENRNHMVLKPSSGTQGSGVLLGWRCTAVAWKQALTRAVQRQQAFIVQERAMGVEEPYPERSGERLVFEDATTTFEPFVWNGDRTEGAITRVSTADAHNVADGCSVPPLWIIDRA